VIPHFAYSAGHPADIGRYRKGNQATYRHYWLHQRPPTLSSPLDAVRTPLCRCARFDVPATCLCARQASRVLLHLSWWADYVERTNGTWQHAIEKAGIRDFGFHGPVTPGRRRIARPVRAAMSSRIGRLEIPRDGRPLREVCDRASGGRSTANRARPCQNV